MELVHERGGRRQKKEYSFVASSDSPRISKLLYIETTPSIYRIKRERYNTKNDKARRGGQKKNRSGKRSRRGKQIDEKDEDIGR